jgi:hypothetical protein
VNGMRIAKTKSLIAISVLAVAGFLIGCASTGQAVAQLAPGMPKEEVLKIMGSPNDRSFRGTDEAWQYQEIAGFGQCKYSTVWISDGKLLGISTRRGASVAGCGLGSEEFDWSEMPEGGGSS